MREDGKRYGVKLDSERLAEIPGPHLANALLSLNHYLVWFNDDHEEPREFSAEDQVDLALNDPWREQDVKWYMDRSPFKDKEGAPRQPSV